MQSKNRGVRKRATEAKYSFFKDNEESFDRIFEELVKVRTNIAGKLGYNNFVELGYARMQKYDYDSDMVKGFRRQVLEYIVPEATALIEKRPGTIM